jgi:hypothetical protein
VSDMTHERAPDDRQEDPQPARASHLEAQPVGVGHDEGARPVGTRRCGRLAPAGVPAGVRPLVELGLDPLPVTELTEADLASVGLCPADLTPDRMAALAATRMSLASVAQGEPPRHVVRRWHSALTQLPPPRPVGAGAGEPDAIPTAAVEEPDAIPTAAVEPGAGERRSVGPARDGLVLTPASSAGSDPAPSRTRIGRTRIGQPRGGLAILAAAAAGALVLAWLGPLSDSGDGPVPGALPDQATARPGASPTDRPGPGRALVGKDVPVGGQDYGPLADPGRRADCLRQAGAGGLTPLAARQVSWSGRPAVLLVLPTSVPGELRILVVTPDCGPDSGGPLADFPAGR